MCLYLGNIFGNVLGSSVMVSHRRHKLPIKHCKMTGEIWRVSPDPWDVCRQRAALIAREEHDGKCYWMSQYLRKSSCALNTGVTTMNNLQKNTEMLFSQANLKVLELSFSIWGILCQNWVSSLHRQHDKMHRWIRKEDAINVFLFGQILKQDCILQHIAK